MANAKLPYLSALELQIWLPRHALPAAPPAMPITAVTAESSATAVTAESSAVAESLESAATCLEAAVTTAATAESSSSLESAVTAESLEAVATATPSAPNSRAQRIALMAWPDLLAEAQSCQACDLCRTRTQAVFGVGNQQADWLVIGEGPGADEDAQGEPFVGRAGKLLNPMLQAIGLRREQVYITNIVRCRPPNNREPSPEEAAQCRPLLERQMALVRPRIILALGRVAAQNLLNTDVPIGKLRGQVHHYGELRIPLVVLYHPAYLLRSPREKRKAWDDLRMAQAAFANA